MIFINPRPVFESLDFEVEPLLDVIGLNEQLTESYVSLGKPKEMEQVLEFSFKKIWEAVKRFFRNLIDKIKGFFSRKKKEHQQKSEEIKKTLADADKKVEELKHQKPEENKSDLKVGDEKPGSRQVVYTPKNSTISDTDKNAIYKKNDDGRMIKSYTDKPTFNKKPPKMPVRTKYGMNPKKVQDYDLYQIKEEVYTYKFNNISIMDMLYLLSPVEYYDKEIDPLYKKAIKIRKDYEDQGYKGAFNRYEQPVFGDKHKPYIKKARELFGKLIPYVGTVYYLTAHGNYSEFKQKESVKSEPVTSDYIKKLIKSENKTEYRLDDIKRTLESYDNNVRSWDKSYEKAVNELNKMKSRSEGELSIAEKLAKEEDSISADTFLESIKNRITLINKSVSSLVIVVNTIEGLMNEMVNNYSSIIKVATSSIQNKYNEEWKKEKEDSEKKYKQDMERFNREEKEYFNEKRKHEEELAKWEKEKGIS